MNRRHFSRMALLLCTSSMAWAGVGMAAAADEAPDAMVQRLSNEVLETLRTDKAIRSGNINRIIALVDKVIMPHVNFRRMMAAAVGPAWRKATPEQQQRLQDEFKILLVRTYAGALTQVNDETVRVKPLRAAPEDKDVLVRTRSSDMATRSSSTTASRKPPRAGAFTTSTSWACGWWKPTAPSLPRKSTPAASMA